MSASESRRLMRLDSKQLPRISVLVAAWNEEDIIGEHIESFRNLRYPSKELILCAGGSDATFEVASRVEDPSIILLHQEAGMGKQAALRECLLHASGELLVLTDADCVLNDDAMAHLLDPLLRGEEIVTTGASRPLQRQMSNPFVLQRWFIDLYDISKRGDYSEGILGRNAAITMDLLESIGGFREEVRTGTDYFLARKITNAGARIRFIRESVVETAFPETFGEFVRAQSRWLRNVVIHGKSFGFTAEARDSVKTSLVGLSMLILPAVSAFLHPLVHLIWMSGYLYAILARIRYLRYGEMKTGVVFPARYYSLIPIYVVLDFVAGARALLEYLFESTRSAW